MHWQLCILQMYFIFGVSAKTYLILKENDAKIEDLKKPGKSMD